jgi:hypothetical protein
MIKQLKTNCVETNLLVLLQNMLKKKRKEKIIQTKCVRES